MRFFNIIALLLIFLGACTSGYQEKESRLVDYKIGSVDSISEEQYFQLLRDLNDMFDVVYHRAECIIDSGIYKKDLRIHLKYDSIYCQICPKAMVIDSILNDYIKSGNATPQFLNEYKETTAKANKKAQRVGLY